MHIINELEYETVKQEKYLVVHGDIFDSLTLIKRWLSIFGDMGYGGVICGYVQKADIKMVESVGT